MDVSPSLTVCSVTGIDPEGHQRAIDLTADAIPFPVRKVLHVVGGMDHAAYSRFMVKDLYRLIKTDFAITVQSDGYAIHPECWSDEFLEYDYIGACWPFEPYVGNGGLSLRSKRFLEASSLLPEPDLNEDWHLCVIHREDLERNGLKFAPPEVASRFSYELPCPIIPNHDPEKAWGWHGYA